MVQEGRFLILNEVLPWIVFLRLLLDVDCGYDQPNFQSKWCCDRKLQHVLHSSQYISSLLCFLQIYFSDKNNFYKLRNHFFFAWKCIQCYRYSLLLLGISFRKLLYYFESIYETDTIWTGVASSFYHYHCCCRVYIVYL